MKPYDQALDRLVAPRLEAHGFARRGTTWNRRRLTQIEVINFQRSSNNTDLGARFTVNLGMAPFFRADSTGWVPEVNCPIRQRIGHLRPERQDHWYRYMPTEPQSVEAAVAAAITDIEAYGLDFFNRRPGEGRTLWLIALRIAGLVRRALGRRER